LRQRAEDIPQLVRHFVSIYTQRMNKSIDQIPAETMDALVRYRWPGIVSELQNFIERAVILSSHAVLRAPVGELERFHPRQERDVAMSGLAEVERDHIVRALEASNWVVAGPNGAAERLGMKRTSLVYRMQKLGIRRTSTAPHEGRAKSRAAHG
jgi:formate hydrogenlyase transcriptional activator